MISYEKNDRTSIIDKAIKNNLGDEDEIQLYNQLSIGLELTDDDFTVVDSRIENGIHFGISTKFPHGLPISVSSMFFNIDFGFNINIKETSKRVYNMERHFQIIINKN